MKLNCNALIPCLAVAVSLSTAAEPFGTDNTNAPFIVVFENSRPSLAVWEDGVFLLWPLPNREDFCLIGRYPQAEISKAMHAIAESGFHDLSGRGYVVPDSDWKEIYVRTGSQESRRAWHECLNPGFGGDINTDPAYRQFVRAWLKTAGAITSLAPFEVHRLSEVKGLSRLRIFRGVNLSHPRKTQWPRVEGTSNKPSGGDG